jgi:hypothetical protein
MGNMEAKEQHQVNISNRFAALEHFDDNEVINRAWESIKGNVER